MIVKIEQENGGWFYIDGITTVYSTRGYLGIGEGAVGNDTRWYFFSRHQYRTVLDTENMAPSDDCLAIDWSLYINDRYAQCIKDEHGGIEHYCLGHITSDGLLVGKTRNPASVTLLEISLESGKFKRAICGGEVYLLNNEGRTIERL